jgi:hypothetical protein
MLLDQTLHYRGVSMNFFGLILGASMLLVIGAGHIIVVKGEYYFGTRLWPIFLIIGISAIILSAFVKSQIISGILGIAGFTLLWSIHEIVKQKERVRKGWFPENPDRQQ